MPTASEDDVVVQVTLKSAATLATSRVVSMSALDGVGRAKATTTMTSGSAE
jgi:hypothetical protein